MALSARRRKQGAEHRWGSLHVWLSLRAAGPARHCRSPRAALSSPVTPGPSGLSPSLPPHRRSWESWKLGSPGNDAAAQDWQMPGSPLGCLRPSLLQTPGLGGRHLHSPAGPESWVWQRGAGILSPAPHHSTSLPGEAQDQPLLFSAWSQSQPGCCSATPGALRQCHCEFGAVTGRPQTRRD